MKVYGATLMAAFFGAALLAQGGAGSIAGKATDPAGAFVTGLTVEARNTASGTVYKSPLSAEGDYTIADLPAGTYEVSLPVTRGPFVEALFMTFVQKDVVVRAGETSKLDIAMKVEGNLATLGDQPISLLNGMRARTTIPTGPTPRHPDGKPDLSGVWLNQQPPTPPTPPALQPWAEKIRKEREETRAPSPLSLCLPSSPVPIMQNFPFQLVHNPSIIVFLNDLDFPGWSQIFLDGRPHPTAWNPAWFGHATGTWEGDTLVVDVVGFNDQSFLAGAPHTEQLHVTERIRRPDAGHLEVDITAEDPGAFTAVWTRHTTATLGAADEQIMEYLCENNVFPQHLVR